MEALPRLLSGAQHPLCREQQAMDTQALKCRHFSNVDYVSSTALKLQWERDKGIIPTTANRG